MSTVSETSGCTLMRMGASQTENDITMRFFDSDFQLVARWNFVCPCLSLAVQKLFKVDDVGWSYPWGKIAVFCGMIQHVMSLLCDSQKTHFRVNRPTHRLRSYACCCEVRYDLGVIPRKHYEKLRNQAIHTRSMVCVREHPPHRIPWNLADLLETPS